MPTTLPNAAFTAFAALLATSQLTCGGAVPARQATVPFEASKLARVAGNEATAPGGAKLEPVAFFSGPMVTGVTVSRFGRVFVCFPRWLDPVESTVAELVAGQLVPFPNMEINRYDPNRAADTLVSVQSVVVDPADRLWLLDTGNINFGKNLPNAPKLIAIDLATNRIQKTIHFPPEVALPTTYLNDVRFDLTRGAEGTAFITDSSGSGPNGIIVVDLASGRSWRRLHDHPSTKAEPIAPVVEGTPLMRRPPKGSEQRNTVGADGVALSADGKTLYYRPLIGHHLHSVSADALADEKRPDAEVAKTVQDLGDLGFASDGMDHDAEGRLYLTDYDHHAVRRRLADGTLEIVASDPRLIWPDTLALSSDGYLYVTVNQIDRQPQFHGGKDLRKPPYALFRLAVDAKPITAPAR